ncbi:MAG: hypothetical protein JRL30_13420 [Deltaproteobacteria bacterium]|nr:hypothetical protein [Deltaproteobacteria bacterium]
MTNSKDKKRAGDIIEKILEITHEAYLQKTIDGPVEEALAAFEYDANIQMNYINFINTVTDFLCHIYLKAPGTNQNLSRDQNCAESLLIIDQAFGTHDIRGYEVAFAEAFVDLGSVLSKIAGFIITKRRERYIRWVYTTCIDPLNWPDKCLIAEMFIEKWRSFLPSSILSCTAAQLADVLPQLFKAVQSTEAMVQRTIGSDIGCYQFSEMVESILPLFQIGETESSVSGKNAL